jgi:hypothetical protein
MKCDGYLDPQDVEPNTAILSTLHPRRVDNDIDGFVDHVVRLLDAEGALVDLSHHDRHGDHVELRVNLSGNPS